MYAVRTGARLGDWVTSALCNTWNFVQVRAFNFGLGVQEAKIWWRRRRGGRLIRQREQSEQRQESRDLVVSGQGQQEVQGHMPSTQEALNTCLQNKTNLHHIPTLCSAPEAGKA